MQASAPEPQELAGPGRAALADYVAIARPDHWFKNVFMLPGAALAVLLSHAPLATSALWLVIGLIGTCLIVSANYTINEWLDAEFDRHHPAKHSRPGAAGRLRAPLVYLQWAVLTVTGLAIAAAVTPLFLVFSALLLVMGLLYNVPPVRTKDRPYLDVLSESINNPIRLILGWATIVGDVLPPGSILLAYWMGGAYLMAMKRYAEYRFIDDAERAGQYRLSFRFYTEESLLASSFFYALLSAFFLGVFLIKYRIEYLLSMPALALLFTWYLVLGMRAHSPAQHPERLYRERGFMLFIAALCLLLLALTFVDLPWLEVLTTSRPFPKG
jgi:decaprenyl-phosphate phosphoribosyltransferase